MKTRINLAIMLVLALTMMGAALTMTAQAGAGIKAPQSRPQGPCDIYAAAGDACVAAHSTTRALYAGYNGPLYQVLRQSDGKVLNIGVVQPGASDAGGYADAAAQDAFCANTYCWITTIYDQSPKHNDLTQAPRGGFSGPAMGGFNNLPVADMAPITIMGHKAYGVFIVPGMGLRQNDVKGTAVDDQAEGQYWVINGLHFNNGCCFDYGNAEIDSRDDDNGTMETAYFGNNAGPWFHGILPGPWIDDRPGKQSCRLRQRRWIKTLREPADRHLAIRHRDGQRRTAPLDDDGWRRATGRLCRSCLTGRALTPPMTRCASREPSSWATAATTATSRRAPSMRAR